MVMDLNHFNPDNRSFRNTPVCVREYRGKIKICQQGQSDGRYWTPLPELRKRTMPLKNSLPEAFSALILVFSNQDGEYLWLPLLLSRALSAV
jgi:hypothetical protein